MVPTEEFPHLAEENPLNPHDLQAYIERRAAEMLRQTEIDDSIEVVKEELQACMRQALSILRQATDAIEKVKKDPRLLARGKDARIVPIDFEEAIVTGESHVPVIIVEDLLRSMMVHRRLHAREASHSYVCTDIPRTYDLLRRWLERRKLAVNMERGTLGKEYEDSEIEISREVEHFRTLQQGGQYQNVSLDQFIPSGVQDHPEIRVASLVKATLLTKAEFWKQHGKLLNINPARIYACYEKCENFLEWMMGARQLAGQRMTQKESGK